MRYLPLALLLLASCGDYARPLMNAQAAEASNRAPLIAMTADVPTDAQVANNADLAADWRYRAAQANK